MKAADLPFPGHAEPGFWRKVLIIWAGLAALALLASAKAIIETRFPDPDDLLRLLQVRDWLAGQSWFDVHQYRINAPQSLAMHWSRLIDPPLAFIILILTPLLGQAMAETLAMVIVPLLTLGCAVALVARFARRLFGSEIALLACLIMAIAVPVAHQLRPMRIDHHGWQMVMALLALNGAFARDARRGAWLAGAALAFWLSVSMEGLPMAAAFMGLFALRWLRNPNEATWLREGSLALALFSVVFFVISHGLPDFSPAVCDAMAPVHLLVLGGCAAGVRALTALPRPTLGQQLAGLATIGISAIGLVAYFAPQCINGAFSALDPIVRTVWFDRTLEGLPIWRQEYDQIAKSIGLPLLGLWAVWKRIKLESGRRQAIWIEVALLMLASFAVALLVERASAVAALFCVPAVAWWVHGYLHKARQYKQPIRRVTALAGMALALAPAMPVAAITSLAQPEVQQIRQQVRTATSCERAGNLRGLNALAPADFLVPLDTGPAMLYASHHRIVASGHHRGSAGMRDVIEAFRGSPEAARQIIARRAIAYVAYCPGLYEPMVYQGIAPDGLMARLMADQPPGWLVPLQLADTNGLRVYRVITTQTGGQADARKLSASPLMQ